jgi:hypothetical protein
MADEFDAFLVVALAPEQRGPDRAFVARVQAGIRLDEQLRAERRSMVSTLAVQFLGIAAIAAAIVWLLRSPEIGAFASESPAFLLLILLVAFSFVIMLFSSGASSRRPGRTFSGT